VQYRKIRGRLSLDKAIENAIAFLKEYSHIRGICRDEVLAAILGQIVFRTGAIVGWLHYMKGRRIACISTHPIEETDFFFEQVECETTSGNRLSLGKYLKGLGPHDDRKETVKTRPFGTHENLVRTRKTIRREYKRINKLLVIDLSGPGTAMCSVRLLLEDIDANTFDRVYRGVWKFGEKLRDSQVWKWKRQREEEKWDGFLDETSGAGLFASFEARMTIYPEEMISKTLNTIQDTLHLYPSPESPYPVYFLWPDRYVRPSNHPEKFLPYWRHWPTRTQMEEIRAKYGDDKLEKFIQITWSQKTSICNRVSSTKMPYYSENWRKDLIQDYKYIEAEITRNKDVFQVPILWSGLLLAIAAVNTKNLTLDEQRCMYELVLLKSTSIIVECAERDIRISGHLETLMRDFWTRITHDIKLTLLGYCSTQANKLTTRKTDMNDKIAVDRELIDRLSLILNYQLQSMSTNWITKSDYNMWKDNLRQIVQVLATRVEITDLVEKACMIVNASGFKDPPCKIECDNCTMFGAPDLLLTVFVNLIGNSKKFTLPTEDEPQIAKKTISILGRILDGNIVVEVTDRAGGMSHEAEKRCLEYGFKEGQKAGLGIGLTITKDIVIAHHGSIQPDNDPGVGCTFKLTFPLNQKE